MFERGDYDNIDYHIFLNDIIEFFDWNIENYKGLNEEKTKQRKQQMMHLKRYFNELISVYFEGEEKAIESLRRREIEINTASSVKYSILKNVYKSFKDPKWSIFQEEIDLKKYVDYLTVVGTPICLIDIRKKIDKKEYTNYNDFINDLYRIFNNSKLYNIRYKDDPNSVYAIAEKGLKEAELQWSRASVDVCEGIWRSKIEEEHNLKIYQEMAKLYIYIYIISLFFKYNLFILLYLNLAVVVVLVVLVI